jgi:hypothetical protein
MLQHEWDRDCGFVAAQCYCVLSCLLQVKLYKHICELPNEHKQCSSDTGITDYMSFTQC